MESAFIPVLPAEPDAVALGGAGFAEEIVYGEDEVTTGASTTFKQVARGSSRWDPLRHERPSWPRCPCRSQEHVPRRDIASDRDFL